MRTKEAYSAILSDSAMSFIEQSGDVNLPVLKQFVISSHVVSHLLSTLNYQFSNIDTLFRALVHTSFAHEFSHLKVESYERLEFLGDSVLGAIVSHLLWTKFSDFSEGELSRFRAAVVNEDSLAKMALSLELQNTLLLGKGEILSKGRLKSALLCDAFESLIGAIYLDGGFEKAMTAFLMAAKNYEMTYGEEFFSLSQLERFDSKTKLQEETMALYKSLPRYEAKQMDDQTFVVDLYIEEKLILTTQNISKKKAERELAYKALNEKLYLERQGETSC